MHGVMSNVYVVGTVKACASALSLYVGVRLFATGVDIVQRFRRSRAGDPNAWEV
jgi:hypothetical protein